MKAADQIPRLGPPLVSVPELAEAAGLKPSTIRSWILQKRVRAIKMGGENKFTFEHAQEILAHGPAPCSVARRSKRKAPAGVA